MDRSKSKSEDKERGPEAGSSSSVQLGLIFDRIGSDEVSSYAQ